MLSWNFYYFWSILLLIHFCHALEKSEELFKKIGKHKIVHPRVLRRLKRSTVNDDGHQVETKSLYIALNQWTIKTNFNDDLLISSNYVAQWVHSAGHEKPMIDNNIQRLDRCTALRGTVKEVENSSVLLTLCDNDIFGLITVEGKSFFLQPVDTDGRHALYQTKMPSKLSSMMDDYNSYSTYWTVHKSEHSTMDNKVDGDEDIGTMENVKDNRCMALEIGKHGQKYITVEPFLCPGKSNHSRPRRQSRNIKNKYKYKYKYPDDNRPYRVTQSCFDRRRDKRALTICDTAEYYNMTSDVANIDYLEMFDSMSTRLWQSDYNADESISFANEEIDSFSAPKSQYEHHIYGRDVRQTLPLRPGLRVVVRWAKIVIGVDYDVIRFHGDRTQQYVFSIFNIVSSLFKQISTNNVLKIVIMKMIMYPNPEDSAVHAGETKYPLYSVNKWNRNLWHAAKEKHDMAVWYTHFRITEEVSTSPGAFMCQSQWSCLLVEDVGWLSAIKIAHGIGHLLGLTHDGDLAVNNNCALESLLKTTIMAKYIPAIMPVPLWSACSIREFEDAIKKYPCLERPPISYEHTSFMAGTFSLDDQCRIEFGDGWVFCSRISVPDPCKELWCNKAVGKRRSCMTRQTVTLDGTACGRGKRCINHTCEDATRPTTDEYGRPITTPLPTSPFHISPTLYATPVPIPPDDRPYHPPSAEYSPYPFPEQPPSMTPSPYGVPGQPPPGYSPYSTPKPHSTTSSPYPTPPGQYPSYTTSSPSHSITHSPYLTPSQYPSMTPSSYLTPSPYLTPGQSPSMTPSPYQIPGQSPSMTPSPYQIPGQSPSMTPSPYQIPGQSPSMTPSPYQIPGQSPSMTSSPYQIPGQSPSNGYGSYTPSSPSSTEYSPYPTLSPPPSSSTPYSSHGSHPSQLPSSYPSPVSSTPSPYSLYGQPSSGSSPYPSNGEYPSSPSAYPSPGHSPSSPGSYPSPGQSSSSPSSYPSPGQSPSSPGSYSSHSQSSNSGASYPGQSSSSSSTYPSPGQPNMTHSHSYPSSGGSPSNSPTGFFTSGQSLSTASQPHEAMSIYPSNMGGGSQYPQQSYQYGARFQASNRDSEVSSLSNNSDEKPIYSHNPASINKINE